MSIKDLGYCFVIAASVFAAYEVGRSHAVCPKPKAAISKPSGPKVDWDAASKRAVERMEGR